MRARDSDFQGFIDWDGLRIGYEVFGKGEPCVLLMPTWTIFHSRFWKFQVPYLSRRYQVITFDGPGNGLSDRSLNRDHYTVEAYAGAAIAVLDECGVDRAVAVGLSKGGAYTAGLAASYPDRVLGIVLFAASIGLLRYSPKMAQVSEAFFQPYPEEPKGWDKYNLSYWQDQYEDFVDFYMKEIFSERYSTKGQEDAVGWALQTSPDILEADAKQPAALTDIGILDNISCPVLTVHGSEDRVVPHETSVEIARRTGGSLHTMVGSGHDPLGRDPIHVNLLLRDFIERVVA